jgi:hypothetical protein
VAEASGSWQRWSMLGAVALLAAVGTIGYLRSPDHDVAPILSLRQLDLLYLDEPAPGLDVLGVQAGRPAVVLFGVERCELPELDGAQVVCSQDPALAARYALRTSTGRVGPGYALVDSAGQLRYRTFDPAPAQHIPEIEVLVDALRGQP